MGAVIALAILAIVVLLSTGQGPRAEMEGDLIYLEGDARSKGSKQANLAAAIADVTDAGLRQEGDSLVFSARMAARIGEPLKVAALEFRWEISTDDHRAWTVTALVDKSTEATVFSSAGFGSGTVDSTLPGFVLVDDDIVEVALDITEVPEFPTQFQWSLTTILRAFRDESDSPRVSDRYPDEGTETFGA